jgi:hypothetical protein
MSLTLVGHALSYLVAYSSHARLSATRRACAAPDRPECGVVFQQSADRWIFPRAGHIFVMWRECWRMSRRLGVRPIATWPGTASALDETCSPRAQR